MNRPRIAPIYVYSSSGKRPEAKFLEDVLNYIDRADMERVQQISQAVRNRYDQYLEQSPWKSQGDKVRRAAV